MANNIGKITQIIGAVLDIKFTEGNLPEINDAIKVPTRDGKELVVEVSQHLGDDIVRCIAMGRSHGDTSDCIITQMLRYFYNQFFSISGRNFDRIVDLRQIALCKFNIQNGTNNLGNLTYIICHAKFSLFLFILTIAKLKSTL